MSVLSDARLRLLACLMLASSLAQSHTLLLAFAKDEAPISYVENGEVTGSIPDMARLIFALVDEHRVEMTAAPWPRAQRMVEAGRADGFVTYPSDERRRYALFTEQAAYHIDFGYLIYHRDNPNREQLESAQSFEDLRGLRLIGQNGADWERDNIPAFLESVMANSLDSMMHLLMRRQVGDFVVMSPEQAIYIAKQLGYRSDLAYHSVDFIPDARIPIHLGIARTTQNAEAIVAAAEAAMNTEVFRERQRQLIDRYRD